MARNTDNSRFHRPPFLSRTRKRKGVFTRLGQRLDFWCRKLGCRTAAPSAARPKVHRPLPPAPVELFDDLKIATPRPRTVAPALKKSGQTGEVSASAEASVRALPVAETRSRPARKKPVPPQSPAEPAPSLPETPESPAPTAETALPCPDPPRKKKPRPLTPAPLDPREAVEKFGPLEKSAKHHRPRPSSPPPHPDPPLARPEKPRRRLAPLAAIGLLAALIAAGAFLYHRGDTPPTAKVARIPAASLPKVPPLTPGLFEALAREREEAVSTEVTIAPGSSLSKTLDALGITSRDNSRGLIDRLNDDDALNGVVRPGDVARAFWKDREKTELKRLEYYPADGGAPLVARPGANDAFWLYSLAAPPLTIEAAREGVVESSLWEAGGKAGLDSNLIMSLADILASDIDFISDIKTGDRFQVLYTRDYQDGRPVVTPVIDMVKMTNQGTDYEFYRYVNSKGASGYFDPRGRSNVKTFFASPLQYKRISSGFTMRRRHPIFKTVRPHQGVDYAAPSGTPVSAVTSGTVTFCGWNGGFGRLVTIRHDDTYTTMYAHLSRFAPGLKKGSVVKQGDLIGNVGATGTATGPHLDFRLKKNGVFINPVPELAKQEGKLLEAAEAQAFTQVVTRHRKRMTYQLAGGSL